MDLSERHARRLLAAYRELGAGALAHGNRDRRPHNAVPEAVAAAVVRLAATRYPGANHTHLTELLEEHEDLWERYSDLAPPGAVLMSTFSDFVRLTVQRKCPFGWSLMVDDAAPWRPGGPPARTYLLMVLREMPSSRAVARIESPCRRAC